MIARTEKLVRLFNYIVVFVPVLMASFFAFIYLCGGWGNIIEGHIPDFYSLKNITNLMPCMGISVLWMILIAVISVGIIKIQNYIQGSRMKKILACVCIFLIAFSIRFLLLYIFSEDLVPFSDFNAAWERAKGNLEGGKIDYYSLFPAYLNFSLYENIIIRLFGENYIWVLYLNALYNGITASAVFLVACEISNREGICILAGVIYALYPANVMYITIGTPEFITILFNTIGTWTLVKAIKADIIKNEIVLSIVGGLLLGIGGSFKLFSIIIAIAFVMVILVRWFIKELPKTALVILTVCLLVFAGHKISSSVIISVTSDFYEMQLSTKTSIPHYLLIGLNTEGEGQISLGSLSRLYYQEYLANGLDYETAKGYAYSVLKEDWKNNSKQIFPNFAKKMIWAWQDDQVPLKYFLNRVGIVPDSVEKNFIYGFTTEYAAGVMQIIYISILLLAGMGAFYFAGKKIDYCYEFIALIIFGYFCMIFLSEGQSRYKCLVMGYVMITSALGVQFIIERVEKLKNDKNMRGN